MPTRDEMLATIARAYEARCNGDKAELARLFAPDATFALAGVQNALSDFAPGRREAGRAIGELIDQFTFHSVVHLDTIIEGDRAAVRSRVVLSTGGGDPVTSEVCDLIDFDEGGRIAHMLQFADTALVQRIVDPR